MIRLSYPGFAAKTFLSLVSIVSFGFGSHASAQTVDAEIPVSQQNATISLAVDSLRNRIYVGGTHYPVIAAHSEISVVDGETNTLVERLTGITPLYTAVNPNTNRLYVISYGYLNTNNWGSTENGTHLTVINLNTNTVEADMGQEGRLVSVAVNPSTNRIYLARYTYSPYAGYSEVLVFDGADNSQIAAIPLGNPYVRELAVNVLTNRVYAQSGGGIGVINGTSNTIESTLDRPLGIYAMAINEVTNRIYTIDAGLGAPRLGVFNCTTNQFEGQYPINLNDTPQDITVDPATNRIYIQHLFRDDQRERHLVITTFSGTTNTVVAQTNFLPQYNSFHTLKLNLVTHLLYFPGLIPATAATPGWWTLRVSDPIDATPPILSVGNVTAEATSAEGAQVYYSISATDNSNVTPTFQCSIPTGSLFPLGTTIITCIAVDTSGNSSVPQSFTVNVLDTGPNLLLPEAIFTDATGASGATVNYVASANDAVSGDLPATCSPAPGSLFPVGETTVTCTATDEANNTSSGEFQVFVLTYGQEGTSPGYYVPVTSSDSLLSLTFSYVEQPGVTTIVPIDPGSIGNTPSGFAVSDVAYEISTTSAGATDRGVQLTFVVPNSANMSQTDFESLRVLHNNNGTLEDVTSGYDYDNRIVYAYTYSFSPFYLVRMVTTNIETLFDRSTAYKAGSTIPVKIRVRNGATNANLSSSTLMVTARSVKRLGASTALMTTDSGSANPDNNFRYLGGNEGAYIFNLSTKNWQAGSYALSFYVGSDHSFFYTVKFQVK